MHNPTQNASAKGQQAGALLQRYCDLESQEVNELWKSSGKNMGMHSMRWDEVHACTRMWGASQMHLLPAVENHHSHGSTPVMQWHGEG